MKTLVQMLQTVARENAGRMAVVDGNLSVSYELLEKRIRSQAARLYARGVRKGDRVALFFPNGFDFVSTFFSIISLGAVAVPLNHQYQQNEVVNILEACGVSLIVTSPDFASSRSDRLLDQDAANLFLWDNQTDAYEGDLTFEIDPDSPAMYQLTSGSTGKPKRIARTHANLLFEVNALVQTFNITHEDRLLGVAPFSHVNGLMRSMMASLRAGATLYPIANFERHAVIEAIEKNRISVFIGVPFMFSILAKTNFRRQPDLSSLRLAVSASAPMPKRLNQQFHERFGMYVRQLYGSTETGTISVNLSPDVEASLESVGKPITGVQVETLADNGAVLGPGETGEVAVKSPAAIDRYDGEEELNKRVFREGFFLTGDLGWKDPDGRLYLVGRKKLFINKGGYKINPLEIEELLESHPKVEEAVVLGLPTPFGDEKVTAMVVLNAPCTVEEIIGHCRGKVADFKIPSLIEFREWFPKSPTGKIRREMLS